MRIGAMAITALVGAMLALQVGMAGTMRGYVGSPMAAALVNFAVGTMFLVVVVALGRGSLAVVAQAGAAPWWAWGAGILGGIYITASATFGSTLGGATFIALIVAGQMIAALALDHYGLLGFPVRPIDAWRVSGALLVICGMFLLARQN
jgi:bacterial/archaeal transporter family-2 protein